MQHRIEESEEREKEKEMMVDPALDPPLDDPPLDDPLDPLDPLRILFERATGPLRKAEIVEFTRVKPFITRFQL